ncbi:hypothetical protein D3C83_186160 [compost metagenome]
MTLSLRGYQGNSFDGNCIFRVLGDPPDQFRLLLPGTAERSEQAAEWAEAKQLGESVSA